MKPHVGHIGIVVKDAHLMVSTLCKALAIPIVEVKDNPEKQMKFALVKLGGIDLEILEDYNPDGKFSKFNFENGNAIHHICLLSDCLEKDIELLEGRGIEMSNKEPTLGLRGKRIVFTAEGAVDGLTFEFSEP